MDRSEKMALSLGILFLVILFGAVLYAKSQAGVDLPGCVTDVEPYSEGKVDTLGDKRFQIQYVARMWLFLPSEVRLPVGSEVDIYVVSHDVVHGLHIVGTDVNLMAVPGAIAYKRYKFDKPGVYYVRCHEYCGVGHQNMEAKIIVE